MFEGPLDLLLKLIERRQLEISKVSLAEVAESFLRYLDSPRYAPGPAGFVRVGGEQIAVDQIAVVPAQTTCRLARGRGGGPRRRACEAAGSLQARAGSCQVAPSLREAQGLRSYERPAPENVKPEKPTPEELGLGLDGVRC